MDVWNGKGRALRFAGEVVREGREKGVDGIRICGWSMVEDEIGSKELMVGDFIAGSVVACEGELEEETTEAGAGKEEGCLGGGWEVVMLEVGEDEVEDRLDLSLKALSGPVAVELADGGVRFGVVVGFGFVVPELRAVERLCCFDAH